MKISYKAFILSAFVFPGAGYFIVQQKMRGIISILIVSACFICIMFEVLHRARTIAQKMMAGEIPNSLILLKEITSATSGELSPQLLTFAIAISIIVWIFSSIDCYRLGKSVEVSRID